MQAVKCQPASSEKKAVANPMAMYATLSNIVIEIMIAGYKNVGINTLQMERCPLIIIIFGNV
ncbi:MAG: hypothetical protein WA364_28285 [Candidatus Nitrosopolaris sp.]